MINNHRPIEPSSTARSPHRALLALLTLLGCDGAPEGSAAAPDRFARQPSSLAAAAPLPPPPFLASTSTPAKVAKRPDVDIVGIALGMSVQEVLNVIQARKARVTKFQTTVLDERYGANLVREWNVASGKDPLAQPSGFSLQAVSSMQIDLRGLVLEAKTVEELQALQRKSLAPDTLTVSFALFPDENRVLEIQRRATTLPEERSSVELFRDSLVKKYGAPTSTNEIKSQTTLVGLQPSWVYPANAPSCYATAQWSTPERKNIESNLKISADSCGSVLAFNLTGNPVTRAESRLVDTARLIQNRERNAQHLEDYKQRRYEEEVDKARTAPSL